MISSQTTVVLERTVLRVARLTQEQHVASVSARGSPTFSVVSGGLQGPVGTVAEDVLARAEAAEAAAGEATALAEDTATDLASLTTRMRDAFLYHAGVISAQE